MTIIHVCVGSACHLKGSYNVIYAMQEEIDRHKLGEKVMVKAIFCLERCSEAVSVKINEDNEIHSVAESTVEQLFLQNIIPRVQ